MAMYIDTLPNTLCVLGFLLVKCCLPDTDGGPNGSSTDQLLYLGLVPQASQSKTVETDASDVSHPLVYKYCNKQEPPTTGHEGTVPKKYRLRQVHVVLTSGARAANTKSQSEEELKISSCFFRPDSSHSRKMDSFIETADIYKNVQRYKSGFKNFDILPLSTACKIGQLTSKGASHMINIGELFSDVYLRNLELGVGLHQDHLSVRSIVSEPAYQSTIAFLHGLLPEKLFAKTIVYKSLSRFCAINSDVESCHCSSLSVSMENITKSLDFDIASFPLSNWNPSPSRFSHFMNDLCESIQNSKPLSTQNYNFTYRQIDKLVNAGKNYMVNFLKKAYMISYATLYTYPFFTSLITKIKELHTIEKRIFIYMADDLLVYSIISSLGIPELLTSGSRVVFEIFEDTEETGKYFLRILLNGKTLKNNANICTSILSDGMCLLSNFEYARQRTFENMFSKEEYETICNL